MKWRLLAGLSLAGAVLLSACSTGGSSGASGNSDTSQAGKSNSSTAPVNLTWFSTVGFWNPPSTWNTDPKSVQGVITQKTGLTFNFNIPAQDADTKLSLMMVSSSENLPDIMTITNDVLAKKLIQAGKVWSLEELIKKYDSGSHLLKDFPNDVKKGLIARDGGWYAYPSHMSSPDARATYPPSSEFYSDGIKYRSNGALMINEQLMRQAGLTLADLKTEDGLLAAYKKIKDMNLTANGAPVIPLQVDGKSYQDSTLSTLQSMFGAMPVDKDGNYRDTLLAPETKHALEFLFKAAQGGFLDPGQLTVDTTGTKAAVLTGRVFSFIGNTANTGFSDQENWVSPGPLLSNQGAKPVLGMSMKAGTGWMQTYISKSTKEPERVAKWLSFMSSDEGMLLHYYGIQGTGYTLNDKGLVVQTKQGELDSKDYAKTGVFAFWPFHHISFHDHVTQAPTVKTGADGLVAMQVQTAVGKAKETVIYDSSVLSLPNDFIPAGSKMANDQAQIKTYKEAQISKMILAKDADTMNKLYNEMISKLKDLGIDAIGAKINEQVLKQSKDFGVTLKGTNS